MYGQRSAPLGGSPTLLSTISFFWIFSVLILQIPSVASRNVHNHLLYTRFRSPISNLLLSDHTKPEIDDLLETWVNTQDLLDSVENKIQPTPSRQYVTLNATPSASSTSALSPISPTPIALYGDNSGIHRRDYFTSNVCPISTQTTIYVSIDGTSTVTVSTTVGPRPTGIPGDAGTSDGTDPTGGSTGTGSSSGKSFGDKEGLITGLAIVIIILLASFCALCAYFYKRRRNARLQRLSMQQGSDPADIVRRMGSKGFMNISAQGRNLTRLWRRPRLQIQSWSPVAFFGRVIHRLKTSASRNEQRDSQSSELLEWKRQTDQRSTNYPWSEAEVPVVDVGRGEKSPQRLSPQKRESPSSLPEIISSPAVSDVQLPTPPKPVAKPTSGEPSNPDFVPLVQRRVSSYRPPIDRLEAIRPIAIEPVRLGSTPDLTRETSPRRASTGDPLSPSAWMAGFGLASATNIDPFNNPSYVSSSDHDHRTSTSGHSSGKHSEDPTSPRSATQSFSSDRTPRGRQRSPQRAPAEPLSTVSEHEYVRPDGASDIMSTLGSTFHDRPGSRHSLVTLNTLNDYGQTARYNLSDVEEVLTPVADERLSMQPPWRSHDSVSPGSRNLRLPSPIRRSIEPPSPNAAEFSTFRNPFADEAESMISTTPATRTRRQAPRKKSEATSLSGGVLPSEKSGSISITGTSIVDPPQSIDTAEWDDVSVMRKESEQLFYARSNAGSSQQSRR